jgi:hypothetical protein
MSTIFNQTFEDLKSKIAKSLKETLHRDAAAPAGERHVDYDVHVPYHQLIADDSEDMAARAVVTYVVDCPSEKKHTVRIKFNYDKSGKFLKNTMTYV